MAWASKDEHEAEFYSDLSALADPKYDRVAAICAPVIVEDRLTDLIKGRWHDVKTSGGQLHDQLFREGGELGSFATKIRLGFACGYYSETTLKDLTYISKIRNRFAHKLDVKRFADQQISAWIMQISIPDTIEIYDDSRVAHMGPGHDPTKPDMKKFAETMLVHTHFKDMRAPRDRFLRACEILSVYMYLDMAAFRGGLPLIPY